MTTSPETLVTAAGRLLLPEPGSRPALSPGLRARAAAILLRMALELALDAYWNRITPSMTRVAKHRMLCLEWYTGHDTARRFRTTWSALSAACHHRTGELPPSPAEIHVRLHEVTALLTALQASPRVPA
ncbi:hypothetical protein DF268_17055 [Streptomyces sp. V2]|uniref:hypothetical protein n=1 Tax=Streptomyces sp. V2 TaxID=1424099 RepID=UPI000D66C0B1|nr:hypothetical protein [Streptomyces sp. V2]PWG12305.1 hypothetical protein DF268_17055 [Streptomyces sp. V2]